MELGQEPLLVEPDERFGRFNFHPEAPLADLVGFLRVRQPSRVAVVSGPTGIGRSYVVKAALHRLQQAGERWNLVDLNLEGYEPDQGNIEQFIHHAILRRYPARDGEQLVRALTPILERIGNTLESATFFATLLGLAQPIGEIVRLIGSLTRSELHALPGLPAAERLEGLLDQVFQVLSQTSNVAVLVRQPHLLPELVKRLLLRSATRIPAVALVFLAGTDDAVTRVVGRTPEHLLEVRLRPLRPNDIPDLLRRGFPGHQFPADLLDCRAPEVTDRALQP